MNDLFRSMDGDFGMLKFEPSGKKGIFWKPVYGLDRELETLFCNFGGHTSEIANING